MVVAEGFDTLKNTIAQDIALLLADIVPANGELLNTVYETIERPKDETLGDFAFPAFRLAKQAKKSPADLAAAIAAALMAKPPVWLKAATPLGAFLNLRLNQAWLAEQLIPAILSGDFFKVFKHGEKARVMIEYSQPNTHKLFHVGHMRNVALGDSLWRLYDYLGHPVIPVNYIGDEGSHIAKCIWHMQRTKSTPPATGRAEWLGEMYAAASTALEDAKEPEKALWEKEVSEVLAAIESKAGPSFDFWKTSRQWSIDAFDEIYQWLDARFDRVFYESEVSAESQKIVDEYLKRGIFKEDAGAIGTDLKEYKLGFMLLRKRDGNTLYATKDLVLARRKFEGFRVDRSVYVVGAEQIMHFKQVFKTLELMGFPQAKDCFHLSYGLVVLPEGKMSSRSGTVIPFSKLKSSMEKSLDSYLEKYKEVWTPEELQATRHKLCAGAIKYGMLCSDPSKDIVFDLENWLSFEGDTGPYLMYAYARTRSILRKAEEAGYLPATDQWDALVQPEEAELMRRLQDFNGVVKAATEAYKPSILAHHLFVMSKTYNRFHHEIQVLKAETEALRGARLALIEAFASVLKTGLNLLGINPPERM